MTNLKDQIQQEISKERDRSDDGTASRLGDIRAKLDELSHATDKYSLKVGYAKGPYSADIAVIELYDSDEIWVAMWQVAATVGGSVEKWEVTYNPHGVETRHEWFRNSDDLFKYLTASIAERVIRMEARE